MAPPLLHRAAIINADSSLRTSVFSFWNTNGFTLDRGQSTSGVWKMAIFHQYPTSCRKRYKTVTQDRDIVITDTNRKSYKQWLSWWPEWPLKHISVIENLSWVNISKDPTIDNRAWTVNCTMAIDHQDCSSSSSFAVTWALLDKQAIGSRKRYKTGRHTGCSRKNARFKARIALQPRVV